MSDQRVAEIMRLANLYAGEHADSLGRPYAALLAAVTALASPVAPVASKEVDPPVQPTEPPNNSPEYWQAKAQAYGGVIQELWAILGGADGKTDIRDAVRKLVVPVQPAVAVTDTKDGPRVFMQGGGGGGGKDKPLYERGKEMVASGEISAPIDPPVQPTEPKCLGDPGECAYNGACMYACGRMRPPVQPMEPNVECPVCHTHLGARWLTQDDCEPPVQPTEPHWKARYLWILHNGGLLNEWAREWAATVHKNGTCIGYLETKVRAAIASQEGK